MEGSFGSDLLVGDARPNAILGQPGRDTFVGNGGDDVIDARDGVQDRAIQCGPGDPPRPKPKARGGGLTKPTGYSAGRALMDPFDPPPFNCAIKRLAPPSPASTASAPITAVRPGTPGPAGENENHPPLVNLWLPTMGDRSGEAPAA